MIEAAGGPIPPYGSQEWLALPEGNRRKVAAVVVAAESWARDGDELAERLAREVEEQRRAEKRSEDAEYVTEYVSHRKEWRYLALVKPGRYAGQQVRPLEEIGAEAVRGAR